MLPIQSDVPLPKKMRSAQGARPRKYPFEQLEVGQMFFIDDKKRNTLNTYFSNVGKKLGRKFAARMLHMRQDGDIWVPCAPDDAGATLGIGVWRME